MRKTKRDAKKKAEIAVVFDWDDVVFNTAAFKREVADALAKQGIPRELVLETFKIAKDARGYDPAIHARMITSRAGGSARKILRMIWSDCRSAGNKLLFADAVNAVKNIRKRGTPLYVLSAGRRRFQRTRIYGSALAHLFEKIYIVDITGPDAAIETKAAVLLRLAKRHKKLIFLDDRPKTVAGIRERKDLKGGVLPVLVWRKREAPPPGLVFVRSLKWPELSRLYRLDP